MFLELDYRRANIVYYNELTLISQMFLHLQVDSAKNRSRENITLRMRIISMGFLWFAVERLLVTGQDLHS